MKRKKGVKNKVLKGVAIGCGCIALSPIFALTYIVTHGVALGVWIAATAWVMTFLFINQDHLGGEEWILR